MGKDREARMKGYEGDSFPECGNFTLVPIATGQEVAPNEAVFQSSRWGIMKDD